MNSLKPTPLSRQQLQPARRFRRAPATVPARSTSIPAAPQPAAPSTPPPESPLAAAAKTIRVIRLEEIA